MPIFLSIVQTVSSEYQLYDRSLLSNRNCVTFAYELETMKISRAFKFYLMF